jgi:hypothetical protein
MRAPSLAADDPLAKNIDCTAFIDCRKACWNAAMKRTSSSRLNGRPPSQPRRDIPAWCRTAPRTSDSALSIMPCARPKVAWCGGP